MEDLEQRICKFRESEVDLLMKLINKYKDIVENKKTDAVMWKQKQGAWEQIAKEFNALNGTYRSTKNIKCKYENLKKTAKKKFALEKRNLYKTGGGSEQPVNITSSDEKIKEIIGISLEGLVNNYDSDSFVFEVVDEENKENVMELKTENWSGWSPAILKTPMSAKLGESKDMIQSGITDNDVPLLNPVVTSDSVQDPSVVNSEENSYLHQMKTKIETLTPSTSKIQTIQTASGVKSK